MKDLHSIQLQILRKLLFAQALKYTELKPDKEMENNKFDFHLDQIIRIGYIQKSQLGYSLTSLGKEYANRMDTDKVKMSKQAKISVFMAGIKIYKRHRQFLIYTRLKQPFYGAQGFPSGKVMYGESVEEAATREFFEETGLIGKPEIMSIRHYRVFDQITDELLEDKFMFLCRMKNPKGKLIDSEEGKFEWVPESKIFDYVTYHFVSLEQFRLDIEEITSFTGTLRFEEINQKTDKF